MYRSVKNVLYTYTNSRVIRKLQCFIVQKFERKKKKRRKFQTSQTQYCFILIIFMLLLAFQMFLMYTQKHFQLITGILALTRDILKAKPIVTNSNTCRMFVCTFFSTTISFAVMSARTQTIVACLLWWTVVKARAQV